MDTSGCQEFWCWLTHLAEWPGATLEGEEFMFYICLWFLCVLAELPKNQKRPIFRELVGRVNDGGRTNLLHCGETSIQQSIKENCFQSRFDFEQHNVTHWSYNNSFNVVAVVCRPLIGALNACFCSDQSGNMSDPFQRQKLEYGCHGSGKKTEDEVDGGS